MAGLVIGGHPLLFLGEQHGLTLGAHQHLVLGQLKVVHDDLLAIHARGAQGGFVDHVGQVGATETGSSAGQYIQVGVVGDGNLLHVYAKNLFAAAYVGQAHHHAAVEASRAQQRRIEHVGAVGGGYQNHAVVGLKAVHLHE